MNNTFETGATTHAVNDLILFTDNTRDLAEFTDSIYKRKVIDPSYPLEQGFKSLLHKAVLQYKKEFPNYDDHDHIENITAAEVEEYLKLYVDDFENWKEEHNLQS